MPRRIYTEFTKDKVTICFHAHKFTLDFRLTSYDDWLGRWGDPATASQILKWYLTEDRHVRLAPIPKDRRKRHAAYMGW